MISTINKHLKYNLTLTFNFSIGVFLFILFFRPFDATYDNVNNLILFFSGFAGILFILNNILFIAIPALFPKSIKISEWKAGPPFVLNALALVLNSVAFTFYLRYVGKTSITFHIVYKIVLICLSVVVLFRVLHKMRYQNYQLKILHEKLKDQQNIPDEEFHEKIELTSENKAERIKLRKENIYTIKAADNYIEINYKKNGNLHKKLLRNTLKNIESQLEDYSSFVRCHRAYIVNLDHVLKFSKNYSGNQLLISDIEEEIPVSRHYLLKVKEKLNIE